MVSKKFLPLFISGLLLAPVPIAAEEGGGTADFDVDDFYAETMSEFADMKASYSSLASNYGNVPVISGEDVYLDYLSNISKANEDMNYEEKLNKIKDTDMSVSSPELNAMYSKLRSKVTSEMKNRGFDLDTKVSDFDREIYSHNQDTLETLNTYTDNAQEYDKIVEYYKNKSGTKPGTYTGTQVNSVFSSVSSNPLTKSTAFKNGFRGTSEIFDIVNEGRIIEDVNGEDSSKFLQRYQAGLDAFRKEEAPAGKESEWESDVKGLLEEGEADIDALKSAIDKNDSVQISKSMKKLDAFFEDNDLAHYLEDSSK